MSASVFKGLLITGSQRTGTTALRNTLESTGQFWSHGEIFQSENPSKGSFVNYAKQLSFGNTNWSTYEYADAIVDSYLSYLNKISGSIIPLMDIKLNYWLAITPTPRFPTEPPFLLRKFQEINMPILVTYRRSLADQVISYFIARKLDRWHNLDIKSYRNKVVIDVNEAVEFARNVLMTELLWSGYFKNYRHALINVYEETQPDLFNSKLIFKFLKKKFDIHALPNEDRKSIFKSDYKKENIVKNYSQVFSSISKLERNVGRPYLP